MVGRSLGNKSDQSDSRSTSYSDEGEARDRYTTEDAYSDEYVSPAASLWHTNTEGLGSPSMSSASRSPFWVATAASCVLILMISMVGIMQ